MFNFLKKIFQFSEPAKLEVLIRENKSSPWNNIKRRWQEWRSKKDPKDPYNFEKNEITPDFKKQLDHAFADVTDKFLKVFNAKSIELAQTAEKEYAEKEEIDKIKLANNKIYLKYQFGIYNSKIENIINKRLNKDQYIMRARGAFENAKAQAMTYFNDKWADALNEHIDNKIEELPVGLIPKAYVRVCLRYVRNEDSKMKEKEAQAADEKAENEVAASIEAQFKSGAKKTEKAEERSDSFTEMKGYIAVLGKELLDPATPKERSDEIAALFSRAESKLDQILTMDSKKISIEENKKRWVDFEVRSEKLKQQSNEIMRALLHLIKEKNDPTTSPERVDSITETVLQMQKILDNEDSFQKKTEGKSETYKEIMKSFEEFKKIMFNPSTSEETINQGLAFCAYAYEKLERLQTDNRNFRSEERAEAPKVVEEKLEFSSASKFPSYKDFKGRIEFTPLMTRGL
jgi:hypothetical protein